MRRIALAATILCIATSAGRCGEISFAQEFALAKDRQQALAKLIPGTQDYYFYHCLNHQNLGQLDKAREMLSAWAGQFPKDIDARYDILRNRQALLEYDKDPKAALEHLKKLIPGRKDDLLSDGLTFDQQKEVLGKANALPSKLDSALLDRDTLGKKWLNYGGEPLAEFEDSGLDWLLGQKLTTAQRRALLVKLPRPDYPNLVQLVLDDLAQEGSGGFGSLSIHRRLLLSQFDEMLKAKPDLLTSSNFVLLYVSKLQPGPDVDLSRDPKARQAHLERLWAFVSKLPASFNSLKAHVLYHRLILDRSQGVYDKDRFFEYLKLPRPSPHVNADYIARAEFQKCMVSLDQKFDPQTLLPPIRFDDQMVRDYLAHFFLTEEGYKPYSEFIREEYLREVFAQTRILNGLGDASKNFAMLSPDQQKAIKERVDIDFAYTNKTLFGADEPVEMDLLIKNVPNLIVKVYHINTLGYYRATGSEIDASINLDGLVANQETIYHYDASATTAPAARKVAEVAAPAGEKFLPGRQAKRHFAFADLKGPGVYVIDFIGSGVASRALVRKGQLNHIEKPGPAGILVTVIDQDGKKVPDARVYLAGHEYTAGKDGAVTIPYSTDPGERPIVLASGEFASIARLNHMEEKYTLEGGFHVPRESLLPGMTVKVALRAALQLNSCPLSLKLLEDPVLTITSMNIDGMVSVREVPGVKLVDGVETVIDFRVPERLERIAFQLKAKVQNLSQGKKQDVEISTGYSPGREQEHEALTEEANVPPREKDRLLHEVLPVAGMHLTQSQGSYVLDILGRNGEPIADRPVRVSIKLREFKKPVVARLQSDAKGRIDLGKLGGVELIGASLIDGLEWTWIPLADQHSLPFAISGREKEPIFVPYAGTAKEPSREELSLLETQTAAMDDGKPDLESVFCPVRDWFSAIKIDGGLLKIEGLPAGNHLLTFKETKRQFYIVVRSGPVIENTVLSPIGYVPLPPAPPLQIARVEADKDNVRVFLQNARPSARVHVIACKYMPDYSAFSDLNVEMSSPAGGAINRPTSSYLAGRDLGEEYRYILDRAYAKIFPGNMLTRPGLLLNPWDISRSITEVQEQEPRSIMYGKGGSGNMPAGSTERPKNIGGSAGGAGSDTGLDFLGQPAVFLTNLAVDANGVVTIPRKALGAHSLVIALAVDDNDTAMRHLWLDEQTPPLRDLRLPSALDATKHFAETHQVTLLAKGESFSPTGMSRYEMYDSLASVYNLYRAMGKDRRLKEFAFVLDWPKLKDDRKRELYSTYACHELNFFLSRKDPEFFQKVVGPYLKNKKDKTFMDHYLLGDNLSAYATVEASSRLNAAERVLLAGKLKAQQAGLARQMNDMLELHPSSVELQEFLFQMALKSSGLRPRSDAPRGGGGGGGGSDPYAILGELPSGNADKEEIQKELAEYKKVWQEIKEATKEGGWSPTDEQQGLIRKQAEKLYRKVDTTLVYAENNYYQVRIEEQTAGLVKVSGFWKDYIAYDGKGPFLSKNIAQAAGNFTDAMMALAVLDLPFEAAAHTTTTDGAKETLTLASPAIIFHKEIRSADAPAAKSPILVSESFYRLDDPYTYVGSERLDKYVTDEFLTGVAYGGRVVITNPTSSPQRLDVVLQIPAGAIPLETSHYTHGQAMKLAPFETKDIGYLFYFPGEGSFAHYGATVSREGAPVAAAASGMLKVVPKPSKPDTVSWQHISQEGAPEEVIKYLQEHNLYRLDLEKIAWRLRGKEFFGSVRKLLAERFVYDRTVWSYGLYHNDAETIREFLAREAGGQFGPAIDCTLLKLDPVETRAYQHLEFTPLVNARAHPLGKSRVILNDKFHEQYEKLMTILSFRAELGYDDLMCVTYYLLLQDRVEEALAFFARAEAQAARMPAEAQASMQLQRDYFLAYLAFYSDAPATARPIAAKYADYPVDRWRKLFANVLSQVDEIEGKAAAVADDTDRAQVQGALAAREGSFDFKVEAGQVAVSYQNLKSLRVNYYPMDVELLFSRSPFAQQYAGAFAFIKPLRSETVDLDAAKTSATFALPKDLPAGGVMIELQAAGQQKCQAHFPHTMAVQVLENYGQVRVTQAQTGKPIAKAYVKVYALSGGKEKFYKDGYTDHRGQFEYVSVSTDKPDKIEKFALLIMSPDDGSAVREAPPPKE